MPSRSIGSTTDITHLAYNWKGIRLSSEIHKALRNSRLNSWGEECLERTTPEKPIPPEVWDRVEIVFDRNNALHRTAAHFKGRTSLEMGRMAWVGVKFSAQQIFDLFPLASRTSYDMPIHQALAHVAMVIGDTDAAKYFPRARLAVRQAAFDGLITLCGNRSRKEMGAGLGKNEVATPIPKEYWETAEITHMATDPAVDDHFHTFPHRFTDGIFGGTNIFLYARLRTIRREILKQWPMA